MTKPKNERGMIPYADPLRAGRHPFQTFMLALCVISGIPLAFGQETASSVQSLLPGFMAIGWGISLSLGAVVALVGSYWPREGYATALTLERIGLLIVGPAALVYGFIIALFAGLGGLVSMCIIIAFGGSCILRARDIGCVFHRAIAAVEGRTPPTVLKEGEQ